MRAEEEWEIDFTLWNRAVAYARCGSAKSDSVRCNGCFRRPTCEPRGFCAKMVYQEYDRLVNETT